MVGSAKLRTDANTGSKKAHEGMRGRRIGLRVRPADDRRGDASDLMGYNYEGSYRIWIPRIGVRDI